VPNYDIYVLCDQCGQQHSVHVTVDIPKENLDKTLVCNAYAGRDLPSEIVYMQSNKYRCPHTKQFFTADNIELAYLFIRAKATPVSENG